ncbi:transient receptor potential cation channel subfamily M member-like 2 isoform X2 [Mytilus galloprovincialis]|uniref:transient receptor potential cation channel subfamily M member-like 2 isoform X2 n=1 Tax=Mytilus galloprovincialis TaxID=29158 RepID=UPI003F7C423D
MELKITVYDVDNTSGFKMEDAVVEAIIKGWSLRDLNKNMGIEDSDSEENVPVITTPEDTKEEIEQPPKQNTVTLNIVKDNNFDTSLMKNYQLTLTPGSLSLFFYIAYQFIQEKEYERKKEDLQLLLLEAIIANRVEYVSVMLQNGVEFDPTHFDKLYNETLKCENCKAKDCRKIHSIHYRISDVVCEQIWSTCDENICKNDAKILCKRHRKGDLCKKHLEDEWESSRIRHYGKLMCQQLLNYATITRDNRSCIQCKVHPTKDGAGDKGADALCEECKEHPKEDCNEGYFSDLLAWALFTNRVQLAGVFWSKCKNQLLTAVMASSLLKNMAENASSAKDRQLHQELLDHSRLFEERVIYMQTALYEECEYKAMLLMEVKEKAWGILVSPMICAYEHNMIDVIGHPCIQRHLNRIWYNEQTCLTIDTSAAAAKWRDWLENACCCCVNGHDPFFRAWFSPLMTFFIHYMFVMGVIVGFSAFLMTDLRIISSFYDIGIYEWLLYLWLIADFLEEFVFPNLIRRNYFRSRKHTCMFKFKRFFLNVWNLLAYLSYGVILIAVCMRIVNSSDFHRMTLRLYSLGLFLMYMRFLQCMIVQSYFGPKIIMIGEMLLELIKFAWILIVFMMCTGVLYHANMYPSHYDMWSTKGVQYWRIWKIVSLPYWQIYGELFLEEIQGQNNANGTCTFVRTEWENNPEIERCVEYDWAVLIIAAIYLLITNLLLVNLIIALFTSRFEEVQKDSDRLWKFWRYSIIMKYRNRDPVPLNLLFLPWKLIRTHCMCNRKNQGDNVIQEAQNLHAVKCLYIQSTKTK